MPHTAGKTVAMYFGQPVVNLREFLPDEAILPIKMGDGSWAVCRPEWTGPEEPGAPSPSGGADDEGRGLRGKATNNRKAILCTGGFQPTDQISGWAPEREQTAQNGKCKLLDVR